MSEMSRQARRAMRAKAHRMTSPNKGRVDASDYGPEEVMNADVKTGLRPVSRRAYKKGGKVVALEGKDAVKHAGKMQRKARKDGGSMTAEAFANVNQKDANASREGKKHVGGMNKGGRAKRASGGSANDRVDVSGFRDMMRQAASGSDKTVHGPGGSSYKRRPGGSRDVVETHHTGSGPAKKLMGKTGKWNVDYKGRALPEWAEKAGPIPRKSGGRAKRDAGGQVPTTLLNIGSGQSMARKAAGLKRGGYADGGMMDDDGPEMRQNTNGLVIPKGGYNDPYETTPKGGPATPPRKPLKPAGTKGYKRGGSAYEGTAKDMREDKKLAKKHHMSMKDWEASDMDKKHDAQRSMKGLKSGGSADGKWIQGAIKHPGALRKALHVKEGHDIPASKLEKAEHSDNPKLAKRARLAETLKRMPRATGGRAKGKTNINIIIGARGPDAGPMPGQPAGGPGAAPIPVPVGPPGLGAMGAQLPGAMPPGAGAPPPMPGPMPGGPAPMPRKRGGRTYASYKDMDAGSGSGDGRLEKTEIAKRKK